MESGLPPARIQGDRLLFSSSDDTAIQKKLEATHAPDGRDIDVKLLLRIIECIFNFSVPIQEPQALIYNPDDEAFLAAYGDMVEPLASTINNILCEISCKRSASRDADATTLEIFRMVSSYLWDAKVSLAVAAFAVYYGDNRLIAQLQTQNSLAKSVAVLKQLPKMMKDSDPQKPENEVTAKLMVAMLNLIKCIVEFKELPSQYTSAYKTVNALIPSAAYWVIRTVVACASQLTGRLSTRNESLSSETEVWELRSLAQKVNNVHEHLINQLELCYQHVGKQEHIEAHRKLIRIFGTNHVDNTEVLKALIYTKDDLLPLLDCSSKKRVGVDLLRRKNVLLLISDLDISHEELSILDQMYQESRQQPARMESQYEVVWLPVMDKSAPWTEQKQQQFENLQKMMPWYTIYHPSLLDPAVTRYIKEAWHFSKKPMLVVLDPQGRAVNPNALHMMWIWGSLAFPFTSAREEALWSEESWRLELLADAIEPMIFQWMQEGKCICLYGGEDMEWIQKFTRTASAVAAAARVPLELLYVGKSNPKEKVHKMNTFISGQNLSHVLPDVTLVWYFWVRLESMWHSKIQHGRTAGNDPIMREIMTILSFDASDEGWAVVSQGSEMAKAKGDTMLRGLNDYQMWEEYARMVGFIEALNNHLKWFETPQHCNRLIMPTNGSIPENVPCAECGRDMDQFILYRCRP